MIEVTRIIILFVLICLNYIFLSTGIWVWAPDLFIIFLLFIAILKPKLPNTYTYILYGFVIDLFFSNQALPYTITFFLIGAYLNLSNIKWIQKSFFEQSLMIIFGSTHVILAKRIFKMLLSKVFRLAFKRDNMVESRVRLHASYLIE